MRRGILCAMTLARKSGRASAYCSRLMSVSRDSFCIAPSPLSRCEAVGHAKHGEGEGCLPLIREPVLNHSPGHGAVAAVMVRVVLLHLIHDGAGNFHRVIVGFFPIGVGAVVPGAALDER